MVNRARTSTFMSKTKSSTFASRFLRGRHIASILNIPANSAMTQLPDSELDEPLLPENANHQSPHAPQCTIRTFLAALLITTLFVTLAFLTSPFLVSSLPRFLRPFPPPKTGFAIVAACANRQTTLRAALKSWLSIPEADQILIVDWSSSPPLLPIVNSVVQTSSSKTPVRVIRVDNETEWVLSRAYNFAIRHASYEYIFKLDCDYLTTSKAIAAHPYTSTTRAFYAGYYENARSASEMHLNGALVLSQTIFWEVGGYDERIQTYGFDDEELYNRLVSAGNDRLNVSFNEISHLDHDDSRRGQQGIRFPRVQIEVNKLLLKKIGEEWSASSRGSEYASISNDRNRLRATYIPPNLASLVSTEDRVEVQSLAFGRRLHDDYDVPWGVIASMKLSVMNTVFGSLYDRRKAVEFDEVLDAEAKAPHFIIIHVQNGLGNRLRVLGSGLAFAKKTNRVPIVVWEADIHFGALFADLFDTSVIDFGVIDSFPLKWPLAGRGAYDKTWNKINFYNYMLADDVDKFIPNVKTKNIYFKSSAIMNTSETTWESENIQIRKLAARNEIRGLSHEVMDLGLDRLGGVHIRNRSLDEDIVGLKDNRGMYDDEDASLLDKWRATSTVDNFIGEMKALLANGTVRRFFVASDTHKVCEDLRRSFPPGVVDYIPRDCDDRGAACEKYALADLLVLAKSEILLGSTWSSFTEAAMRLGGPKALLAGTDFGKGPVNDG